MLWLRKNWVISIVIIILALPIAELLSGLTLNPNGGLGYVSHIPEAMKARILHSGRQLSQWGMPLHQTGEWAIRMMVITLSCTPLSILFGNKKILRYKQVFGIFTFVYTVLHLAFYLADHNFFEVFSDMNLVMALISTLIIIPLGITSNRFSMRLLKSGWKKMQKYAYAAGIFAVLHLALLGKGSWIAYAVILAAGFILRAPEVKRYFANRRINISQAAA